MKIFPAIIFGICLLMFASCKQEAPMEEPLVEEIPEITTIFLVRHAEKDRTDPENADPELNQRGLGRAMHWAEIFDDIPLDAIYSTDYKRTEMTAAPTAVKQDLTVKYYDPQTLDIGAFRAENTGNTILVVGHSNTTPEMANKLIGEERFGMMEDNDNGSLFVVTFFGNQHTVKRLHFNCNCPE